MNKISLRHGFHILDLSPWPLTASTAALFFVTGIVAYFHGFDHTSIWFGLVLLILSISLWFRDINRESAFTGHHTKQVVSGLKLAFLIFLVTEVMVFFSFFWAYFHVALSPSIELGSIWPPLGVIVFNPFAVPLLNTLILLTSGVTVTWAHYAFILNKGYRQWTITALILTIMLGIIFTILQGYEYYNSPFTISDSVFGSSFFMLTGLHGFHVIVGTILITISLVRIIKYHTNKQHHLWFESSIIYWHFVDIIWIFLYVTVYVWNWI